MKNCIIREGKKLIEKENGHVFRMTGINLVTPVGINPFQEDNEADYRLMSEIGMNTARIQMEYSWFEDDDAPFIYKETGFRLLERYIALGKKYGIRLVLDMQHPQSGFQGRNGVFWEEGCPLQQRFLALWEAIAKRFSGEEYVIAYDLINEPAIQGRDREEAERKLAEYYGLLSRTIERIRLHDPEHLIWVETPFMIIGQNLYSDENETRLIIPPVPDENVIYDFHMYHPGAFTHQGCVFPDFANYPPVPRDEGWLDQTEGFFHPAINLGGQPVNYSGEGEDLAEIRKVLKMQYGAIYARNFPCVCGEFGICSEAAEHGGIQWVEDVTDCLDEGEVIYWYVSMQGDSPRDQFNLFRTPLAQNLHWRLVG